MKKIIMTVAFAVLATPTMASAMTYSAIALSPQSGAYGEGHDWPTMEQAKRKAMQYCRHNADNPRDCRVVTWSRGAYCASVAVTNQDNGSVTWGSGSAEKARWADHKAMQKCAEQLGEECDKILVHVCSR